MTQSPGQSTPSATMTNQNRVLALAKDMENLITSGLPPQEYFSRFLQKLLSAVSAPAGAIWLLENGRFRLCCEAGMAKTGFQNPGDIQRFHQRLLADVATNGQSRLLHTDDEPTLQLANRHLLILTSLWANDSCLGVVEVFQRPDVATAARPGYLQFVEQMTGYASIYLERRPMAKTSNAGHEFDADLGRFGLQLQRSLDVKSVAAVAANDGRLLSGCDRVSVILQRGKQASVIAVSGQESIHRRSNLVRSMVRLSQEVIRSGVALKYSGTTDEFPPQVKERLADLVQEGGARLVFAVPLRKPGSIIIADRENTPRAKKQEKTFGCLLIERFHQSEPAPELIERLDWLTAYTAAALYNAQTHQSLFLLPVWSVLGSASEWLRGRKLLKILAALVLLAMTGYALAFIPMDYRVEGDGRLMPANRREIFVPYDGEVVEVLVSSGERVTPGQLLVKLRNNELQSEIIVTESQREEKLKLLSGLLAERDEAIHGPNQERSHRIEGDIAKTTAELRGLERKQQVLNERKKKLNVTSPIEGVVATFEVDQLLRHRPVRRGEILLEVMDDSGPWQLELDVAQHRTGHLMRAQSESADPLPIEYLLVTAPEQTFQAQLKEIGTRVVTSEDARPVVEVLASPDNDPRLSRRIGAEVRAKLHCGKKPLGFVLFGDVIEFVQKYLWL